MPSGTMVKVQLLDDSTNNYEVKPTNTGNVLLQAVMKDLDVLESDYFGVLYDEGNGKTFLDPLRQINKQIKKLDNVELQFVVKFFAPDPSQIEDEYTRYLFALQIKRDISTGVLPCKENIGSQLSAFIVQAEFGDWNVSECSNTSYLNEMHTFPNPTSSNLQQISDLHKELIGKSPAEADYDLLDSARHLEYYGIRLHPALDAQNTKIDLAVTHAGVSVFQGNSRKNTFNWSRMRKLSFKRTRFLVKLRADPIPQKENFGRVLVFMMKSRDECKNFWRLCIEHHAFFRLEVRPKVRQKPLILSRGSSFHYNGKTQKELLELVRNSNFRRSNFVRTTSRRQTRSAAASPSYVGNANKPKQDLDMNTTNQSLKSNDLSSNEASLSQQNASIASSPIMTRQPEDSLQSSPGRSEVNGIVTQAEVIADENQKNSIPEWQLQSKSLHSSATPISEADMKTGIEGKGIFTEITSHEHDVTTCSRNPAIASMSGFNTNTPFLDVNLNQFSLNANADLNVHSTKNDSHVAPAASHAGNVSRVGQFIRNPNYFESVVGKYAISDSMQPPSRQIHQPPPLPPKERHFTSDGTYDNLPDTVQVQPDRTQSMSTDQHVSHSGFSGLGDRELNDPFVNDSMVNLASMSIPMTPEVKAKKSEQKIKIGHYSVPTKPPLPPDGEEFHSPRFKHKSRAEILDKEINEAMSQLYSVINDQEKKDAAWDDAKDNKTAVISDGSIAIVVSSSEEENEYVLDDINATSLSPKLSPKEDPLLAPIKMEFDDGPNHLVSLP